MREIILQICYYYEFCTMNTAHQFSRRHIGPGDADRKAMLKFTGAGSLDALINETVPEAIRMKGPLDLEEGMTEYEYLGHLRHLASLNKVYKTYIGQGYFGTITPPPIQRNILENPGWYTAYTPYQAEIAQGRLEALLNYQTMVMDLTAMPIANASLLDEATAAAEAMAMLFANRSKEAVAAGKNVFMVSDRVYKHTLDVLITRSEPLNICIKTMPVDEMPHEQQAFGALLQYPDREGHARDMRAFCASLRANDVSVAVASDLLALTLLTPPGEWGADVVVGNSQRFGVPMGYGGPHAAFFACTEEFKRFIPGRIIGVTVDSRGKNALRMALQTREQHIRRDKATSNICTAQALLAIMASMYAVYHGPDGLKEIAGTVHGRACLLASALKQAGFNVKHQVFFDTICIEADTEITEQIRAKALAEKINFHYTGQGISISLDETCSDADVHMLVDILCKVSGKQTIHAESVKSCITGSSVDRKSTYLGHPVFNSHHSESAIMRYIKRLENKDLSLTHSMISLGSCTMKLNAAAELMPITWPEFATLHPFVPKEQAEGYMRIIDSLNADLSKITGFAGMSFQPNSGAQGEYAGLMVIRAYHHARGDHHRNIALIPSSAHGTNPASAAMAGMRIVVVKCDEKGNVDLVDLKSKIDEHRANLSCLMVTYPSTHGVYETSIREITEMVHDAGGQVYMDGANMNAQVGLTSPGLIGADVCHLNLHKTFAIPHGGGGPGMGPIGVAAHLLPYLPGHTQVSTGGSASIKAVSAAPFGSALILLISYGYIKMLGSNGLTESTRIAILNANYIKDRLKDYYQTLYSGENGRCAHEMILDCRSFKRNAGVEVADIAKRLMDYGFHAPTVSFPVPDTLMVEPTESEPKEELDRFIEAMISIRKEIDEIESGKADKSDNVLKNAPHTADMVIKENWTHSYSREKAVYPIHWVQSAKFWPSVGRVDNAAGDRHLVCSCPPVENYLQEEMLSH